jgi:hypothetical protein
MNEAKLIEVTSHVGRDLLASASLFKTEAATVWEYVVNSLQYVDPGIPPKVQVIVKSRSKEIEIHDNGRGMNEEGLSQYFHMHGENTDRLRGRPGRGKFGTGKSAAFGIGKLIKVETRKNGIRNVVELHRDSIDASQGGRIPVEWIVTNERTDLPNGTTVFIQEIFLPKINTQPIIEYIERNLQAYRSQRAEVAVNEHVCQFREPTVAETYHFKPSEHQAGDLGSVELVVKVSSTPLSPNERGISVTAGLGNLVALETAGIENKELGNYLFGEIDVPALENADSPIEAYDSTRSLQLNPLHPVVRVLIPFIGSKLEEVRLQQVAKLRLAQKSEEARRLASQAQSIAELLNDDFASLLGKLREISSASASPGRLASTFKPIDETDSEDSDQWIEGVALPGNLEGPKQNDEGIPKSTDGRPAPHISPSGEANPEGDASVDPARGSGRQRRGRAGFNVRFVNLGEDEDRSKYDKTSLTILINLDHPVLMNAVKRGGPEDLNFRRLAYEIAFTEYAVALGYEMADQDPDIPADDLLFEVRTALNRISHKAAPLYS